MTRFPCPYLGQHVELTEEREAHVIGRHPELVPQLGEWLSTTLLDPDIVQRSRRSANARLFWRWFDTLLGGKYVMVVVITDAASARHWIVTAYVTDELLEGTREWERS